MIFYRRLSHRPSLIPAEIAGLRGTIVPLWPSLRGSLIFYFLKKICILIFVNLAPQENLVQSKSRRSSSANGLGNIENDASGVVASIETANGDQQQQVSML